MLSWIENLKPLPAWQRTTVIIGAAISALFFIADWLQRFRDLYDARSNAWTLWTALRVLISETSPLAWLFLAVALLCLVVGTLEWWQPFLFKHEPHKIAAKLADGQTADDRPLTEIPLIDVVRRAFDATKNSKLRESADWTNGGPDEALQAYCLRIWTAVPLFGTDPFSHCREILEWHAFREKYDLIVKNGVAVLRHYKMTNRQFENLTVRAADLPKADAEIPKWAKIFDELAPF